MQVRHSMLMEIILWHRAQQNRRFFHAAHPRLLMAMTTSSREALPARSPMPLMVHSICRAPAIAPAKLLAVDRPRSFCHRQQESIQILQSPHLSYLQGALWSHAFKTSAILCLKPQLLSTARQARLELVCGCKRWHFSLDRTSRQF